MSPLARPFRIILRYLPGAAILCIVVCLVYPWGQSPLSDRTFLTAPAAGCALCLLAATISLASALTGAVQAAPLLRYWGRPDALLEHLKTALDSPVEWKRRLALQILAEHYGLPFGPLISWPGWYGGPAQLDKTIFLYKEWLRTPADAGSGDALSPPFRPRTMAPPPRQDLMPVFIPLGRAPDGVMERAADAVKDALLDAGTEEDEPASDPAHRLLPPLQPAHLADALREPVSQALAAVAERVNAAPDLEGVAACDDEIREIFEALAGHALELAAGLRIDAAAERLPWPAARGEWVKKFRRMVVMESLPAVEDEDAPAV